MSKIWNPGKTTVELRPSRIRREPVRLPTAAPPRSRESEIRAAVIGVAVIAAASTALVVGMAQITSDGASAPAPAAAAFNFCRSARTPDCVIDGRSFRMGGELVTVAGIDAPTIRPARCAEQARLGIEAAVRLRDLLNRGPLTLTPVAGAPGTGAALGHKIGVDGRDVATAMIAAGVARDASAPPRDWCARPEAE